MSLAILLLCACGESAGADPASVPAGPGTVVRSSPPRDTVALVLDRWLAPAGPMDRSVLVPPREGHPPALVLSGGEVRLLDQANGSSERSGATLPTEGLSEVGPILSGLWLDDGTLAVRTIHGVYVTDRSGAGGVWEPWWGFRPETTPPFGAEALVRLDGGGVAAGLPAVLSPGERATPEAGGDGGPRPLYEVRPAGAATRSAAATDTIRLPAAVQEACPVPSEPHFRAGWFEDLRERYVPKPRWTLLPDGTLVAGCPGEYGFSILDGRGTVEVEMAWEPLVVSYSERIGFMNAWIAQRSLELGEGEKWDWKGDWIPPSKPAYQRLLSGGTDRIWVWPTRPSVPRPAPATWPLAGLPDSIFVEPTSGGFDVFDRGGRVVEHVALPSELPFSPWPDVPDPAIRGDTVWAMALDPSGTRRPARFVIRR